MCYNTIAMKTNFSTLAMTVARGYCRRAKSPIHGDGALGRESSS